MGMTAIAQEETPQNSETPEVIENEETKVGAKIEFKEETIDYGVIEQGADGIRKFEFTNTGDAPLIISRVYSSCGCTVPTWSRESIPPGGEGEMLVKFNGSGQNQVSKTVTITANTRNGKETIKIKAFVTPKAGAAGGSPIQVNSSGQ